MEEEMKIILRKMSDDITEIKEGQKKMIEKINTHDQDITSINIYVSWLRRLVFGVIGLIILGGSLKALVDAVMKW